VSDNHHRVWKALAALEDQFARLGGSARYHGFDESQVPIYIGCALAKQLHVGLGDADSVEDLVDLRFLEAASPALKAVKEHIGSVTVTDGHEARELLLAFVDRVSQVASVKCSERWAKLADAIEASPDP